MNHQFNGPLESSVHLAHPHKHIQHWMVRSHTPIKQVQNFQSYHFEWFNPVKFTFSSVKSPSLLVFSHASPIEKTANLPPLPPWNPHHQGEDATRWLVGCSGDHQEITHLRSPTGLFSVLGKVGKGFLSGFHKDLYLVGGFNLLLFFNRSSENKSYVTTNQILSYIIIYYHHPWFM